MNEEGTAYNIVERYASYSNIYFPNEPRKTYRTEMFEYRQNGTYSGIWQIHQFSNVVGKSVKSVYPVRFADFLVTDMDRLMLPRNRSTCDNWPLYIMWCSLSAKGPKANHFVPLLWKT